MITKAHEHSQGYIFLPITIEGLPAKITLEGEEYSLKSEFHISLVCTKRIAPMIDVSNKKAVIQQIEDEFVKFTKTVNDLSQYELLNEYRLVQRDERKTIVQMASVPHLNEFFDALRNKYKIDIPTQPTHVTLYALQPEAGIGLFNAQEVQTQTHIVQMPHAAV